MHVDFNTREAVINAFVHNDYSDLMSPAFYIYSDSLEIVSYSGLIYGMSQEELVTISAKIAFTVSFTVSSF